MGRAMQLRRTTQRAGRPSRRPASGREAVVEAPRAVAAMAILRVAVLAFASGAVGIGAGAVGALAVNRLAINRAAMRDVRIGTLDIERLRIHEREEPATD